MHLVSRLRRILAMTTVLISLLAGLGIASAQADAPIPVSYTHLTLPTTPYV